METNVALEDDTMRLDAVTSGNRDGLQFFLKRSHGWHLEAYRSQYKVGSIFPWLETESTEMGTMYVEWQQVRAPFESPSVSVSLYVRALNTRRIISVDTITYRPFNNVTVDWMGENHDPVVPAPPTMGTMQWAIDQYRMGYDVHAFEEPDIGEPLFGPGYAEIVSAINDRGVSSVAMIGYSHGGGTVWEIANKLTSDGWELFHPFEISFTGFIDAISQNWEVLPGTLGAVNTRPPGSLFHVSQYQRNLVPPLRGAPSGGDDDIDRTSLGVNHITIDDSLIVLDFLTMRYRQKVRK